MRITRPKIGVKVLGIVGTKTMDYGKEISQGATMSENENALTSVLP